MLSLCHCIMEASNLVSHIIEIHSGEEQDVEGYSFTVVYLLSMGSHGMFNIGYQSDKI